eukprot:TRINITY_DN20698_c0_g1_i2.p1 TRINITY_DN20698_c0_g1~~TRINITY_DN20698_c0_g1_i2.p1  ORF type:complete len:165 (-),score=45.81 TRINITY_DN20698_c0_g1_i2:84-578(-)
MICVSRVFFFFFFQAEDGIRDAQESRGLGDVYKRQGLHKPDMQTILAESQAAEFLAPLPARAIPGVGHGAEAALGQIMVHTVMDLRGVDHKRLTELVGGAEKARWIAQAAWGRDDRAVIPKAPSKAISVEDSFMACSSLAAVQRVIGVIAVSYTHLTLPTKRIV